MKLSFKNYFLELIHPFSISSNTRTETPIVLTQLESRGLIGYGEASLPPYLEESQESVNQFLKGLDFSRMDDTVPIDTILDFINTGYGNAFAKASLDIAIHDLFGKIQNKPLYKTLGSNPERMPITSCTLGMASEELLEQKVREAERFSVLKVKLGGAEDKAIIRTIRKFSSKPLYIDANQGWSDPIHALDMITWLSDQGALLIEQPLPKGMRSEQAWLYDRSPLPLIADESCQNESDISGLKGLFSGINIKLMKCGGIREGLKMIHTARNLDMKIMIGCMNESSCAIMAAAALAPQCDYVDLDGPFLIKNNPFEDPEIREGKIVLSERPGLGLIPQ